MVEGVQIDALDFAPNQFDLDMRIFNILLERKGIDVTYDEALALALKELKEEKELLNVSTFGCSS